MRTLRLSSQPSGAVIRALSIAVLAAACSSGGGSGAIMPDAAAGSGGQPAVPYEGKLASVPPVAFGGGPMNFCMYTETVSNLVLDLLIKPDGTVIGGAMQNHNVEAIQPCGMITAQPPSDTSFTLAGAQANGGATQLTFTGAATNRPTLALTIQLTPAGPAYSAALTLKRIDEPSAPALEWTVTATVSLTAK